MARAAGAAASIENSEARNYIPPANASVSTWVGYDTPQAFTISYYTQGQNLGALLDLSIRNDTNGEKSLDDVFRTLYNDNYKKGKGFTTEELIRVIDRLTKKNYKTFFDDYIFGVKVPDYDRIFGYAGYELKQNKQTLPDTGFISRPRNGGLGINRVTPNGPAAKAGLRQGDVIMKVNGEPALGFSFQSVTGKEVTLSVSRGGSETELKLTVGAREYTQFELVELADPSSKQIKIREGWLKR